MFGKRDSVTTLRLPFISFTVSVVKVPKFEKGQLVKVIDGVFKGVVGRVARWQGQQRVGVCIEEIGTIATAYIPNAFIEIVKK